MHVFTGNRAMCVSPKELSSWSGKTEAELDSLLRNYRQVRTHSGHMYVVSALPVELRLLCVERMCIKFRAYRFLAALEASRGLRGASLKAFIKEWNLYDPDCVLKYPSILSCRDAYEAGDVALALRRAGLSTKLAETVDGEQRCWGMLSDTLDQLLDLSDKAILLSESFNYQ